MFLRNPVITHLQALDNELARLPPADLRSLMIGRIRALSADEQDRTVVAVAAGAGAEQALQAVRGKRTTSGAVAASPWRVAPVARHISALLLHGEQALEQSVDAERRRAARYAEQRRHAAEHMAATQAESERQIASNAEAWKRESQPIVVGGSVW